MRVFATVQLRYDVTIRNVEGGVELVGGEILPLRRVSAITYAMDVVTNQSRMKKNQWPNGPNSTYHSLHFG